MTLSFFLCRSVDDSEVFFHLAGGQRLCQQCIPSQEPYSFAASRPDWYNPVWLGEIVLYLFYTLTGIKELWILALLIYGCFFFATKNENPWPGLGILCLLILATFPFFKLHILPLAHLYGLIFWLCTRKIAAEKKSYYPIVILLFTQILWCNTHPSFILGTTTFALFVLLKFLASFIERKQADISYPRFLLILGSLLLCCMVSPYGISGCFQSLAYWSSSTVVFPGYVWLSYTFILLACFCVLCGRIQTEKFAISDVLPHVGISMIWAKIAYSQPDWAIPAIFVALSLAFGNTRTQNVENIGQQSHSSQNTGLQNQDDKKFVSVKKSRIADMPLFRVVCVFLCMGIIAAGPAGLDRPWMHAWGRGISEEKLPVNVGEFLKTLKPVTPLFNDITLGKYLAWSGSHKIFVDQRPFVYSPHLIREIGDIRIYPPTFAELARRFGFNIVVLDHRIPHSEGLLKWLALRTDWHPVYCDHIATVFLKSDPATAAFIEQNKIADIPSDFTNDSTNFTNDSTNWSRNSDMLYRRAKAYLALHLVNKATGDLKKAESLLRECPEAYFLQAKLRLLEGDNTKAFSLFKKAREISQPANENLPLQEIEENLLETCLRMDTEESLAEAYDIAKRGIQWQDCPQIWLFYAHLCHKRKEIKESRRIVKKILEQYPYYEPARDFESTLETEIKVEMLQDSLQKSKRLAKKKAYDEALELLKQIVQSNDKLVEAHLEMGKIYLTIEKYPLAAQCFRSVLKEIPDHLQAQCDLAVAVAGMGDWEAALKMLQPLASRYEDRYELRESLLMVDEMAIAILKKKLAQSDDPKTLFQLVQILSRRERQDEAIRIMSLWEEKMADEYRKIWQREMASLYYQEGKRLLNHRDVKKGMTMLEDSIRLNPESFESHFLLGIIALKTKEWDKAAVHFTKLQTIAPQDERGPQGLALIELGKGLYLQLEGQFEEALQKFGIYAEKTPAKEEKDSMLSRIANLRSIQKQLESVQKAKEMERTFLKGMDAMKQSKWEKASECFEKVVEVDGEFMEARFNLAQAYLRRKKFSLAEKQFLKTLELQPDLPDAYMNLGYIHYQTQNYEKAVPYFEKYLQLDPQGRFAPEIKIILKHLQSSK